MSDVKRYEMHASVSRGVVFRVPVGPPHATKSEDVAFERYVLASHFDALSQQCAALEKRVKELEPTERDELEQLRSYLPLMTDRALEAEKQRDVLVAALRQARECLLDNGDERHIAPAVETIERAIEYASPTGEK